MSLRYRRMRFEALESRELLAATDLTALSGAFEVAETSAQVRLVTTADDVVDPLDDVTSLREALAEAQDGDVVRFAEELGDDIAVNIESELTITKGVTIEGEGRVTIDGGAATRIVRITGNGERVALNGLVLQNGAASEGAGVYSARELTLDDVTIRNCVSTTGGAVYNDATLTVENCAFSGNSANYYGGAIYNARYSELTIVASAFDGNIANGSGGAIFNDHYSTLAVEHSAFHDNAADYNGGAIFNAYHVISTSVCDAFYGNTAIGDGGAIYNELDSTLTVESDAYYGNTAYYGGAICNVKNECVIVNATLAGNSAVQGGALYSDSCAPELANSIVAQNFAQSYSNIVGELASNVNNIVGYSADFVVAPYFNAKGKLQNLNSVDLRLRSTSRAIDAGDARYATETATDLDGNDRVYGACVDIGAYEYQGDRSDAPLWANIVDTLEDSYDLDDGKTSLREALWLAPDYDVIRFASKLQGKLALKSIVYLDAPIAIDGGNAITLDCSAIDAKDVPQAAFVVYAGTTASPIALKDLAITNARYGGAILVDGALALDGVAIYNCVSTNLGGAIHNAERSTLTIDNSAFYGNTGGYGGAIHNDYEATLTISNSKFYDNDATSDGGAIYNFGTLSIASGAFYGNSSRYDGGAIYNDYESTLTISNSALYGNTARYGGAIYCDWDVVCDVTNATLAGNSATKGGAIYIYPSDLYLANTIVAQNYASASPNVYGRPASSVNDLIDAAPDFVVAPEFNAQGQLQNLDTLDLKLRSGSRAIDAGNDSYAIGIATDLDGAARVYGEHVDIGAYEFTPTLQASITGVTQVDKVLTAVAPNGFKATSYQWFVSDAPDGERAPIDGATGATYTISRTYYQKYITVVIRGEYRQSGSYRVAEATSAAIAARKLTKPALKTQIASDSIVVSWKSILRAQGYYVYYKASDDASYTYYGKVSDTQCELQGLDPSTTYSIRVKAVSSQAAYLNSDYTTIAVTTNEAVEYVGPARNVRQAQTVATSIQLAWNSGENADSYRVDVYNAARTQLLASYETTETSVTLTGLTASTSYSVDVVARSTRYGESTTTTFAAKSDAVTKLAIPTVKAAPGSTAIYASWNANKDAVAYLVYYKVASSTSAYTSYGRVYGTSVTLEGLRANTTYSIRVKAVGDNIDHSNSDFRVVETKTAQAITVLPAPENVAVTNVTAASVSTQWDRVVDAQSYRVTVYNHDMTEVVASYETTALSATLTGLDDSTSYRVAVVGVSSRYGESAAVELAFTTTEKQKLARPTVTATATANSIAVSWTLDPEAYKYRVQYRKIGDSAYITLPDFLGDSCTIDGLEPGTSYEVRVKALASGKNPEYVNSDFATVTKKTTV